MSYEMTLEKAGAEVLAFKEFGSYQGTWLALVKYKDQFGIIEGSYGSCSGCDSFQGEFNYDSNQVTEHEGKYYRGYHWDGDIISKEEYNEEIQKLDNRYCKFGEQYLMDFQSEEMIQNRLNIMNKKLQEDPDSYFDEETKEYLEWALEQFKKFKNGQNISV